MPFSGNNVKVGPGTLYVAPLATTEPVATTGAWPAGWVELGYTDTGSTFDFAPKVTPVEVEEEYWPVRQAITTYEGSTTFALAEQTRQNLAISLNAGVGSSLLSATQGSDVDGSIWQETPAPGTEVRVMVGWDALPEGATTGSDPFGRLIIRQALQTGSLKITRRKGANKATYACTFMLEKPNAATQPFRFIFPANLAA